MSSKTWIIFVGACVLLLGCLVVLSNNERLDVSGIDQTQIQQPKEDSGNIGDHIFGNKDSTITLIEYGDFQCNPGCKNLHENMKPIMQSAEYKDKIRFVYRNFPITSIHPNTLAASATAEAAGLQGKYWEMWDMLFEAQAEWSAASSDQRAGL
ncbi:MAG: thioredoxin domain-containing protein, partial [Candidatus Saccharimonadales bacterium]